MKKTIKLITLFVFALITLFLGKEMVFASDNAPKTFKAYTHDYTNNNTLGVTNTINVKKTVDGKYIYCMDVSKKLPISSITYTKNNLEEDPAISYIIARGYDDKTDVEFFATQSALWIYLLDTNQMSDSPSGYVAKIKNAAYSTKYANDPLAKEIRDIVAGAKNAKYASNDAYFKINTDDVEFTLTNGKYVSNVIKIKTNIENDNYGVLLYNEPEGTKVTRVSNGFKITIPEENVEPGKTVIGAVVQHDTEIYNVYKYKASNSNYQNMYAVYEEEVDFRDEISMTIEKEKDPTVIIVSKQDVTNKGQELEGATLVIRNSKGNIVKKWVSGDESREFASLPVGKYTLTEIKAPDGYKLSEEIINFEVKEDGKTKKVIMYNTPKDEIIVSVSKQDITNKEELPGATLIIKDSKGNEKYRWISGEEPYIIKGIKEGTYTLEEIIAPEGYKLSSEKITFEVKDNGVVTEVVMFNTPETTEIVVVPPTGSNATTISLIFGGLIIIIGSVLIYKNVKKEQ